MKIILSLLVICLIIFGFYPELDLKVSSLFYDNEKGFIYLKQPVTMFFYYLIYVLAYSIGGGLLTLFVITNFPDKFEFVTKRIKLPLPSKKHVLFLLAVLLIGPGVVVHWGFKESWDRARPVNIEEFGGVKQFSPPLIPSDQNGKSFVSGHSSMGFYMVAFAFLFRGRKRTIAYIVGLSFGVMVGGARVVQGKHFLSDVTFAALLMLIIIHVTYWFFFIRDKNRDIANDS